MGQITLILGGVRSGKSNFALEQANQCGGKRVFVATARSLDKEMEDRIANHKKERGLDWSTFEEPLNIAGVLRELTRDCGVVLIDCLTLWVSNLMHEERNQEEEQNIFASALESCLVPQIYVVSNEVGMGIVPEYPLGRAYRDQLGLLNRKIAQVASKVILMIAGIPVEIKGTEQKGPGR
jgi:adenosylcobinamide kinase / adenosylcobinamide-phosphate guanylyltransferase